MKKLYRRGGTVHPSPPLISDHLSFLPATILTLTAALSPQDREVLAYLLSCSGSGSGSGSGSFSGHRKSAHHQPKSTSSSAAGDHPPTFDCSCFGCYTSYWARWDSSPNRQLIDEIIDSFEDSLVRTKNPKASRKDRRKRGSVTEPDSDAVNRPDLRLGCGGDSESTAEETTASGGGGGGFEGRGGEDGDDDGEGEDKGSVRKFVSLIGERIWNVWGQ